MMTRAFAVWLVLVTIFSKDVLAEASLQTSIATYRAIPSLRVFDGVVEAKHRSTVSAQTSGQVVELPFDVDDVVAEGTLIVRLNDSEQQANLKDAKAQLKNAAVLQKEAKTELDRIINLAQKKLVSQADLDRARSQFEATQAKYDQAQAQVTIAQRNLEYTVIKAPYSGVVVARHVQIGESVQVGEPLITGFSLTDLRVVTAIPSDVESEIRLNVNFAGVVISSPGMADLAIENKAVTVFPYANEQTHNFKVRIDLPTGIANLYPGNFVKAGFIVGQEQRLLVPMSAIAKRGEVKGIYVVSEEATTLSFRFVVTGRPYEDKIEILSGVTEGEEIALDPVAAAIQLKALAR